MSGISKPLIYIDPKEEIRIVCRILYYRPQGYYRTVEKLRDACRKTGNNFSLVDIKNWLYKQALHQIHMPRPKFIPRVAFNTICIPNEVHQWDTLYTSYDSQSEEGSASKDGRKTYMFCANCVDIASRYKASVPIGAVLRNDELSRENILTSKAIVKAMLNIYNNPDCPLKFPKVIITDKGSEYVGDCNKFYAKYKIKHIQAKSKRGVSIVERYNRTLAERLYIIQDAEDSLLPLNKRSRAWVKNLAIIVNDLNNSVTRLIGMSPAEAIKKKYVFAKPSKPRNGPMGYDEIRLTHNDPVRYLLESGELEGGKRRSTDCNWSPQIYHIKESLVQKNRPVLYWLIDNDGNGPKRSFVCEELMVIPHDTELPPNYILRD
jgi:hypothetical protein